jgi:hypothetical protein
MIKKTTNETGKVEEPISDTLRFRATKESELDMNKIW